LPKASIKSTGKTVAKVSPKIYGSFVEHMGRCVYGGIFEPGSEFANEQGFRLDVLELAKEMGVTTVRYPGGNFVSGYLWEDGVGPKDERPTRLDLAWRSVETNQFGLNEFMEWISLLGAEPIMAINLGTRGVLEAAQLVEYSNYPGGTTFSDWRKQHGVDSPHQIKTWCLGNELDGPWQIGHKSAEDYGKLAKETAKAIKLVDQDVKLVACGSSFEEMPTFGDWEETVLRHTFDEVENISMHAYYEKYGHDSLSFLASSARMDRFIKGVISRADKIAAEKNSEKKIMISFDEWNVWYQEKFPGVDKLEFVHAPRIIEDDYTVEDAVVVGSLLMTLIKNSDRVDMACQAQLANVIGPIRTEPGQKAWKQTTFFPFALSSKFGRGEVIDLEINARAENAELFENLPMVDAVATKDGEELSVFLLNRELEEHTDLTIELGGLGNLEFIEGYLVGGENLEIQNTSASPEAYAPSSISPERVEGSGFSVSLPKVSWSLLRFKLG